MKPINLHHLVLIIVFVCIMSACSLPGTQRAPSLQTYLLQTNEASKVIASANSKSCLSLRISLPASAPGFSSARMSYTEVPWKLQYFAYHAWADTPARMIAAMMESRLDSSGLFGAVLSGSSDIKTNLRLDSEVIRLLQKFESGTSTSILEVKVNLIDVSGRSLLNSQTFLYTEDAQDPNPVAGVAAANRSASRFLDDLSGFVSDSVEHIDCSESTLPESG